MLFRRNHMIVPLRALALTAQRAVTVGSPMLVGVFVARALGAERFGGYALITAVVSGAQIVVEFGLDKLLPRAFVEQGASRDVFRRWLGFKLVLAMVLYCLIVAWTALVAIPNEIAFTLVIYGLNLFIHSYASNYRSLYVSLRSTGPVAVAALLGGIVGLSSSIPLLLTQRASLPLIATSLTAGALVELAVLIAVHGNREWLVPSLPRVLPQFRETWSFALQTVLSAAYTRLPTLALGAFGGPSHVAAYAMAGSIYSAMSLVPASVAVALYPDLSSAHNQGDRKRFTSILTRHTTAALSLGILAAIALTLFAEPILITIYGTPGLLSVDVLRILALALVLAMLNSILGVGLFAMHREVSVATLSLLSVSVAAVSNIILVSRNSELGAAWAMLAADTATALIFFPQLVRPHLHNADNGETTISPAVRGGARGSRSAARTFVGKTPPRPDVQRKPSSCGDRRCSPDEWKRF